MEISILYWTSGAHHWSCKCHRADQWLRIESISTRVGGHDAPFGNIVDSPTQWFYRESHTQSLNAMLSCASAIVNAHNTFSYFHTHYNTRYTGTPRPSSTDATSTHQRRLPDTMPTKLSNAAHITPMGWNAKSGNREINRHLRRRLCLIISLSIASQSGSV